MNKGWTILDVSTMHLRNSTSFLTLFPSSRIESLANCGHPEAIFMSDFGLWNELLSGEGLKVCMMRCHMLWSTRTRDFSSPVEAVLIWTGCCELSPRLWVAGSWRRPAHLWLSGLHLLTPGLRWDQEHHLPPGIVISYFTLCKLATQKRERIKTHITQCILCQSHIAKCWK